MTDDLLSRLDESLGAVREGRKPSALGAARPAYGTGVVSGLLKGTATGTVVRSAEASVAAARVSLRDRWPWVEWFVYLQFLWGALLFIPGSQAYRPIIRALPYASSAILPLLFLPQRSSWTKAPGSASFMLAALGVLVANLFYPTTQFIGGLAQCVFQPTIAAPIFWALESGPDGGPPAEGGPAHLPAERVERRARPAAGVLPRICSCRRNSARSGCR